MTTARFARHAGLAAALLAFAPSLAHAHTGTGGAAGFLHGFAHPVLGVDHLLAMLAVGIFAAQRGGRSLWALPASFVAVMVAGFLLRTAGVTLPGVEPVIVASLLVLGLLVASAVRLPTLAAAAIVGVFALFHGTAHGAEMPAGNMALSFSAGFVTATFLLHTAGATIGIAFSRHGAAWRIDAARLAGAAIAAAGLVLLAG
ncbi:MAG: HupE/UreJ family protein [Longimicrobiales bacterium]